MTPSHLVLGINDSPWDKMTSLQDVVVCGSALGSSMIAKVAIFATYKIVSAIRAPQASHFSFSVLPQIANLLPSIEGPAMLHFASVYQPILPH